MDDMPRMTTLALLTASHIAVAVAGFAGGIYALHLGEGEVSIGAERIAFTGRLAPGPDYKLYLSPDFLETEADFNRLKSRMVRVGDVKTFENFVVAVPAGVDVSRYSAVIVWCETFGQFITAARYR